MLLSNLLIANQFPDDLRWLMFLFCGKRFLLCHRRWCQQFVAPQLLLQPFVRSTQLPHIVINLTSLWPIKNETFVCYCSDLVPNSTKLHFITQSFSPACMQSDKTRTSFLLVELMSSQVMFVKMAKAANKTIYNFTVRGASEKRERQFKSKQVINKLR